MSLLGVSCLRRELGLTGGKRTRKTELSVNTVDAVDSIEVLDTGDLETRSSSLTRGNRRVGKEVFPDLVYISA